MGDHDLVRTGMRYMLEKAKGITVVGDVPNNTATASLINQLLPDVILIDIKVLDITGLDTARDILHFNPKLKILIITEVEDKFLFSRLMDLGAYGYITKNSQMSEMLQAIYDIHVGKRYICSKLAQQLVLRKVNYSDKELLEKLSVRELQVAMMIVRGQKTKEMAEKLRISPKTINTYRHRIHAKLGVKTDIMLAHLIK